LFEGQTITVSGERHTTVVPGETLKSQTCIVPSSFSRTEIIPPLPLGPLNSAIRSQPVERRSAGPSILIVGLFCFAFISALHSQIPGVHHRSKYDGCPAAQAKCIGFPDGNEKVSNRPGAGASPSSFANSAKYPVTHCF
jgi:hypothetical protein